jgi:hypothetical protein
VLILGHQEIDGNLDLAWDVREALVKCLRGRPLSSKPGPAVCALIPGRKMALEFDGCRLWFHNHEGTAPTRWHTTCVPEEIERWVAYFLYLVGLDTWDKETIPLAKAHVIPMRWATFRQHAGPYLPTWKLLRYLGYAPVGAKVPAEPFEGIAERCDVQGLKMKRIHALT